MYSTVTIIYNKEIEQATQAQTWTRPSITNPKKKKKKKSKSKQSPVQKKIPFKK